MGRGQVELKGTCDQRFLPVRDAFAENFAAHGEVGAAVAVVVDGRPVVDLWGGYADAGRSRPWGRDTIANVYSTTKGLTALCALRLIDRGLLDPDATVATYWPEFAQAGKGEMPVRYLLSHRAGLPAIKEPLPVGSMYLWDTMTAALARQAPWWEPGTQHGYHAVTFGWLVGEVVRRVSGKTLGAFLQEEISGPLGIDFHVGLGPEYDRRVAEMIPFQLPATENAGIIADLLRDTESMVFKAFANPPDVMIPGTVNTRAWRAAEIPAANGHSDARALARVYGALARGGEIEGVRVLRPETIARATMIESDGPDAVLFGLPTRFGLGFMLSNELIRIGPNEEAFGHAGAGGSLGFADPVARVGFGYVMNQMIASLDMLDPRWPPLIDAVYSCL